MGNSLQLSTMDELPQQKLSVNYQHGTLLTDISNLQTSEVEFLEINWSDKFSSQDESTRCGDEILTFLESHKFPNVKRLVLNNLFCSRRLIDNLARKFQNIEHLKILLFNFRFVECDIGFEDFTTLSKLEIVLGVWNHIRLYPPERLNELTVSISKVASKSTASAVQKWICLTLCTSLESL